jgi:hypothetical protein
MSDIRIFLVQCDRGLGASSASPAKLAELIVKTATNSPNKSGLFDLLNISNSPL